MTAQSRFLSFALVCIVAMAGIVAALIWRQPAAAIQLSTGTFLAPSRAVPDFTLIDNHGRPFDSAGLRGRWSMLFFGYTNCPDFCPATLSTLAAMEKRLRAANAAVLPQVIFVSVDAKRDTPAQLDKYVPYFDSQFIGLTAADQPRIEAVAKQLGVAVSIQQGNDGNYTVDHSGAIFVLDPDGRITAILTGPYTVPALIDDFKHIVAARGASAGRA